MPPCHAGGLVRVSSLPLETRRSFTVSDPIAVAAGGRPGSAPPCGVRLQKPRLTSVLSAIGLALDLIGATALAMGLFRRPRSLFVGWSHSPDAARDRCRRAGFDRSGSKR